MRSAVDIPVHRDGRLSGILWFNASEPRAWTADEVAVLTHVTQQLRLLLDRADGRERRRQAERDLLRRDAILLAVSRSARLLLEAPSWLEAATDVLALLGEAAGATRAHVFENVPSGNSVPDCVLRAQWSVHGWERDPDDPELDRREPAPHFPRWAGLLETGETVNALTRDLPSGERELMEKLHSRSNLAVPIVVDDVWWGFVGFDDCEREREWTATEEEVLRLAASVLAGAIARERADTVLRAVFETALDAIFITDTNGRYLDVNAAACELLGVPRDDLLGRSVKEFMPPDEAATFERDWEGFQHTEPAIELWHSRRADGTVLDVEA
ncbi:MAG TPA: GAF domain-containing protein, partial [Gaiellaceae bacterium]|nr:GAF domain-containing protein [Gaiellaceae bacterium]